MSKLGVVEDTLFVPMLGRIYASEHCPQILYDKKALELKNKLPLDLIKQNKQNQYTLLASASRSANMDRFIRSFLERRPDGVIVQLGCGLETTYYRCDNGRTRWYAVDLPHVIDYPAGTAPGIGTRNLSCRRCLFRRLDQTSSYRISRCSYSRYCRRAVSLF